MPSEGNFVKRMWDEDLKRRRKFEEDNGDMPQFKNSGKDSIASRPFRARRGKSAENISCLLTTAAIPSDSNLKPSFLIKLRPT